MKVPLTLLSLLIAASVLAVVPVTAAQEMDKKKDEMQKETQWQGHVVRVNKDKSMLDIRGGVAPATDLRKVSYDNSTHWTKQGKPGQQDEFKEGSFVIVLGHVDDAGVMHATRIDLRLPK